MKTASFLSILALTTLGAACDRASDTSTPTQRIGEAIEQADVSLVEAIAAAEADAGAVAIEAKLEPEHGAYRYRVELMGAAGQRRVEIDPEDASVLRSRDSSSGNDGDNAAAAALATGAAWAELVAAAEGEVGGIAFEIEAEPDGNVFEIEVLAGDIVWEIDVSPAGQVVKSEKNGSFDDDHGDDDDQDDDDDDDDHTGGEDHHGGDDDDDDTGADDGNSGEG